VRRKLEDGLRQRLRSLWPELRRFGVFFALCLALSTPLVSAQNAVATPASGGEQLRLARQQGIADTAVLDWTLANSGPLKGDVRAGGMRVAFTITPAEGWWDKAGGGKLAWHETPAGNVHLRVFVIDLADGRLIPGLILRATLIDGNGNEQSVPTDFGWYPLINAYGGNMPIAADSNYTLRVVIDGAPQHHATGEHAEHTIVAEFPPMPVAQEAVSLLPLATTTASAHEAELLKPCNAALTAAITALWQQSVSGAEEPDDDYFVAYALGLPELAHLKDMAGLAGKGEVRLELLARDSRTGRIIPGLTMQASFVDGSGKTFDFAELPLIPSSWLTHYEGHARIPRKSLYTLQVHFEAPGFRRWGRQSERFAAPAEVVFEDILPKPGKKN
jgi:hypothetical protein